MIESRFSKMLKAKIAEVRQEALEGCARGLSHEDYLKAVGKIIGLDMAKALADEVDDEINGGG